MAKHIFADMIIDWANGSRIQTWSKCADMWVDVSEPTWNTAQFYRIKPIPKPDINRHLVISAGVNFPSQTVGLIYDGETGKLKETYLIK